VYSLQDLCRTASKAKGDELVYKAMIILMWEDAWLDPLVVVMSKTVNYFYTSFDGGGHSQDRPWRFIRNLCGREVLFPAVKVTDSVSHASSFFGRYESCFQRYKPTPNKPDANRTIDAGSGTGTR